jgi:L-ribulose-5-phosphate 4-epimerase
LSETGAIKFHCEHTAIELTPFTAFAELKTARQKMRHLGLIGVDGNGIGFGNISVRDGTTDSFYITGSGTGILSVLTPTDCARVTAWDFERNWLRCEGRTIASAESLTHAAVYSMDRDVRIVIHGHSERLWRVLLDQGPTTRGDVSYGTPEMARDVRRLFLETDVRARKMFAMAGHVNGFVAYGNDLPEALGVIVAQLDAA